MDLLTKEAVRATLNHATPFLAFRVRRSGIELPSQWFVQHSIQPLGISNSVHRKRHPGRIYMLEWSSR